MKAEYFSEVLLKQDSGDVSARDKKKKMVTDHTRGAVQSESDLSDFLTEFI